MLIRCTWPAEAASCSAHNAIPLKAPLAWI